MIYKVSEKEPPYFKKFLASKDGIIFVTVRRIWIGDYKPVTTYPNNVDGFTHWEMIN
jgi:hypothetical protein